MKKLLLLTTFTLSTIAGARAGAHPVATSSAAAGSSAAAAANGETAEPLDAYEAIKLRVPWSGDAGHSLGLAYENGSWGGEWIQGVRVEIPLGRHFGINLRGLALGQLHTERWDFGARVDFIGRSPVFLNLVRLYGGGGVQVFRPVGGVDEKKTTWGGGGHFGFEFFMSQWMSWILEVGGNSGSQDSLGSGATIVAGVNFYPF